MTFATAALLVPAAASERAALTASVGPGQEISLVDAGGRAVSSLAAGDYAVTVNDRSTVCNFRLKGPGVNADSGQTFTGTVEWSLALRDGDHTFVCDPFGETVRGAFTVGSPPAAHLVARVDDGGLSLRRPDGAPVERLDPGQYVVRVDDATRSGNFRLAGPGVNENTQVHTTATQTWLVTLVDGIYRYSSDQRPSGPGGTLRVGSASEPSPGTLHALVGPDIAISVLRHDFAPATTLAPGRYTAVVDDRSVDHNLHLVGPGVDRATSVSEIAREAWTIDLTPGTYTFVCDPHAAGMRGSFVVASSGGGRVQRLDARVTPAGRVSLASGGERIGRLPAGRYEVRVRDLSKRSGFYLVGPGVSRRTGARFTGSATWRVQLRPGRYRYGAGRSGSLLIVE